MNAAPPLLWAVLGFVLASRLAEWFVTERNERALREEGAVAPRRDGLAAIGVVHATLFAFLPGEWFFAPWTGLAPYSDAVLGVAMVAVALRYWAALSLGRLYTKRVLRLPDAFLVARGPYRFMRHPIYRAVWVEMVLWPLAFGAFATVAWLAVANAVVLRHRIRLEERHLGIGRFARAADGSSPAPRFR